MAQYLNGRDGRRVLAVLAGLAGLVALFGTYLDYSFASPVSLRRGLEAAGSHRGSATGSSFGEDVKFGTVFLLGIFSDPSEQGARRRRLIRDTYLMEAREDGRGRYCQLSEYVTGQLKECKVVYTFVAGSTDERAPTGLEAEDGYVDPPRWGEGEESDIIYLNVREPSSAEDGAGKTAAWFRFSSRIKPSVDYVSKVDSSTVLSMPLLLDTARHDLPPAPYNSMHYGGRLHPNLATGDVHAAGSFYLASPDLALHSASKLSDAEWRADMIQKMADAKAPATEDALFGAAVFSHTHPIKMVTMAERIFWRSGLNSDEEWVDYWETKVGELPRRERVMPMREWCAGWIDSGAIVKKEMKWLKQNQ